MKEERVPAGEVLDCQVQPTRSFAPLGAVSGGFLLLRAAMCEMTWYFNRDNKQTQVEAGPFSFMANRETLEINPGYTYTYFQAMVHRDALEPEWPLDPDANMKVSCLKLLERSEKGDTLCLFLTPVHDVAGSFRRVALLQIVDAIYRYNPPIKTDFFAGCGRQEVRII